LIVLVEPRGPPCSLREIDWPLEERSIMRKHVAALAALVAALAMAGCSSGTTAGTTTTNQPSTSTSSTVANSVVGTVRWASSNKAVVTSLSSDVAALATALPGAVSSTNPSAVTASCQKLATDVATAKALPPIPNSTAQRLWTSLMNSLSTASQKCSDGVAKNNTGELSQTTSEVSSASSTLKSFTGTLGL